MWIEFDGGYDDENLLLFAVEAIGGKDLGTPRERVRERHGGPYVGATIAGASPTCHATETN